LAANGLSVERRSAAVEGLEAHVGGGAGCAAKPVFLNQPQDLRPALLDPRCSIADLLAIGKLQRIGKRVLTDLRLGIVHRDADYTVIFGIRNLTEGAKGKKHQNGESQQPS